MPANVEIKARIDSVAAWEPRVAAIATHGPEILNQVDTFFPCTAGRLKLREFGGGRGELIWYERPDEAGPRQSRFERLPLENPERFREFMAGTVGVAGTVRKRRTLYLVGRTRVHLDQVECLGAWLELEVVLAAGEAETLGRAEAGRLMEVLGIDSGQLEPRPYVDLLERDCPAGVHSA